MVNGRGELILAVEDEPVLRDLVRLMLQNLGYQVAVAPNGAEASRLVEEEQLRPALLLTDVVMPGTSGAALAENLRRTMPGLKVIFMSGYPDTAIARHRLAESTIAFLQKPFSISQLGDKIKSVLASRSITSGKVEV